MLGSKESEYIKYVYWLTANEAARLRIELETRGIEMMSAGGVACKPLKVAHKISIVAPKVWAETCARQGSWYRNSDKNGLFLVVSAFTIKGYENRKTATLTETNFLPPRQTSLEEKKALLNEPSFERKIPQQWRVVSEKQKEFYLNWAGRLGSNVQDYDFLYLTSTANHANFTNPRLFIQENKEIIPYSIDRSAHLCSCCLELFQILGSDYRRKLVAPCPGAIIYARLKPDRYLLVESA